MESSSLLKDCYHEIHSSFLELRLFLLFSIAAIGKLTSNELIFFLKAITVCNEYIYFAINMLGMHILN